MYDIIDNNPLFLVLSKKTGVSFHNEGQTEGLFTRLKNDYPGLTLHAVHRLDKVTSGLLVAAKDARTARLLSGLFTRQEIQKYYLALSARGPRKMKGTVSGDMSKARGGSYRLLRSQENPAVTSYSASCIATGRYLFLIRPRTGKTHQIRVALKSLGAPITGDPLYSPRSEARQADRTYLHAYAMRFTLEHVQYTYLVPPTEGHLFQEAPCLQALEKLKEPWNIL